MLAAGALVRTRLPARTAHVVNRAVIDVLMPVLLVLVLARTRIDFSLALVLVPTTIGQLATCVLAFVVARALALPRDAQGSAMMTTTFSNTGFLGFPVVLALFGAGAGASDAISTALLVDTVSTTVWLWTFGVVLAARFGSGRAYSARGLARALLRPLSIAVVIGLALGAVLQARQLTLPGGAWLDGVVEALSVVVSVLVFFALGLSLDVRALRGRALPLGAMTAIKLIAMPLVVLASARALGVQPTSTAVAVVQCAMPSAMVSVILSAEEGCDRTFAAGVAALSTLCCVATLPAIGWLLER